MNILIACEESQKVCLAFREKGHNAYSCDIKDCSGGYPEYHIKDDCIKIINSFRWDTRSKTFKGIANAMATQWNKL